jgi:hypothetical protein
MHQPIVKLLASDLGVMHAEPPTVDLAELDPATDKPARSILKTTDPDRYGINVSDYFI